MNHDAHLELDVDGGGLEAAGMAFPVAQSSAWYVESDDVSQCDHTTALREDPILNGRGEDGPVLREVHRISASPQEAELALDSHGARAARVVPRVAAKVEQGRAEVGRPTDAGPRTGLLHRGGRARVLPVDAD